MEVSSQTAYRKIFKTASLFGGVQFLNILFSIIRSKAAAFFLGPQGMGIISLFTSGTDLIATVAKLGIDITAVKEVAQNKTETAKLDFTLFILNKIIWATAILGLLVTVILSPILSSFSFGNNSNTWAFILLSFSVLANQVSQGHQSIIQGLEKHKILARTNILIGFFSLLVTVILYYFYKIDSIIYVIIGCSSINLLFSLYASRWAYPIKISTKLSTKETFKKGKPLIKLGFYLSIVGIASITSAYLLRIYIRYESNITDVGFYQASFAIVNTYIAIVFNALRTDYFPRLSIIVNDTLQLNKIVNQQARVTLLIITPLAIFFILFSNFIIQILYSKDFLIISELVNWTMIGVLFRSVSFSLGYILLAKNDASIFFKTTLSFNILFFLISAYAYHLWGLTGIGIGYCIYFSIHLLGIGIIVYRRYNVKLPYSFYYIFFKSLLFIVIAKIITFCNGFSYEYILKSLFFCFSLFFVFIELNKLLDFKLIINRILSKKNDQIS